MNRLVRTSTALLFLVTIGACQLSTTPQRGLSSARARWAARGPDSYAVTVTRECECVPGASGSVVVTVRAKTVESRVYASSGEPVPEQYATAFPSVEELFVVIDDAIHRGNASIQANYDQTLGYPTRFAPGDPATDAPLLKLSNFTAH